MKIEQFKNARAEDLKRAAETIESVMGSDVNTSPIILAAESIVNDTAYLINRTTKEKTTDPNYWGYTISNFKIPVDTTRHLRPKGIDGKNLELLLTMSIVADFREWDNLNDPLLDLNFNVTIRGVGNKGSHYSCFHLDRHDLTKKSTEPHPIYHIQYSNNPKKDTGFDYGNTLYLDTPRLIHHPLEFILATGFLTSNFFPDAFELIMENTFFPSVYKKYQEKVLKPYFHGLSAHWNDFDSTNVDWPSKELCPILI